MNDFGYNLSKNYVESIGLNLEEYNLSVSDLITYRYSAVSIAGATLGSDAEKIGLSLEDMLIWCSYNTIHCQSSDFVYYFNPNYGRILTWALNYLILVKFDSRCLLQV